MESSISQDEIQKWIINRRKELLNASRKRVKGDKYVWTSSLLLSLEEWVWNQPKKLIDNDELSIKVLNADEYRKYLALKDNKEELSENEQFLLKCADSFQSLECNFEKQYNLLLEELDTLVSRLGLNTTCIDCKHFHNCNKWYTDTPCPHYDKIETVELDKKLFEEVLHELSIASGLYACDNEKMEETFQLNYNDLINKLQKVDR